MRSTPPPSQHAPVTRAAHIRRNPRNRTLSICQQPAPTSSRPVTISAYGLFSQLKNACSECSTSKLGMDIKTPSATARNPLTASTTVKSYNTAFFKALIRLLPSVIAGCPVLGSCIFVQHSLFISSLA
jgi:hypothetical protein